jgi:hypothetical protein
MPTAAFLMPGPFNPAAFGMPGAQNPFTARPPMAPFGAPASAPTGNAAAIPGMDYLRMVADFMSAQATSLKAASAVAGCGPKTAGDSAAEAPPTA